MPRNSGFFISPGMRATSISRPGRGRLGSVSGKKTMVGVKVNSQDDKIVYDAKTKALTFNGSDASVTSHVKT